MNEGLRQRYMKPRNTEDDSYRRLGRREERKDSTQKEPGPVNTMVGTFQPLELLREYISVVLSHPACGILLQKFLRNQ